VPKLAKWPFFLGDAILLGFAGLMVYQSGWPLGLWQLAIVLGAIVVGAWLSIIPFLREYQAAVKLSEADQLANTVEQMKNLDLINKQISMATGQWQTVQDHSARTVGAAKEIADRMKAETQEFLAFFEKANQTEKAHLRLEVEKLRRGEGEWLQVVVRILDHIYALNQAASRSGQLGLISQLHQFQLACRDVARRVGLAAFTAAPGDAFESRTHQLTDAQAALPPDAQIKETLATGFTFQGQLIRKAIVALRPEPQSELPLQAPTQPESPDETNLAQESVSGVERTDSEQVGAS